MERRSAAINEEFLNLLLENQPGLLRTARRILRNEAEAEDIVQDVALSVISAPDVLEGVENIAAWLITLVYRRSIDALRKISRLRQFAENEEEQISDNRITASDAQEEKEILNALDAAVENLPSELKYAFVENTLGEKTFSILSRESGIPMGTLMARKKRAVQLIKDELAGKGLLT